MIESVSPSYLQRWEHAAFVAGAGSLQMMETAAQAVVEQLQEQLGGLADERILFVCGPGNNGGDGLAAARLSFSMGAKPEVLLLSTAETRDAQTNLKRLQELDIPVHSADDCPNMSGYQFIVDALFGIGLSRDIRGKALDIITRMNDSRVKILAVDVPSGLDALTGQVLGECVRADLTVTFHRPKHGLFLAAEGLVGRIHIADIGLPLVARPDRAHSWDVSLIAEPTDLPHLLPSRPQKAHKGDFGRVLVLAGSLGMAGAAAMAAKACLRSGAGLVTLAVSHGLMPILQTLVPGATCKTVQEAKSIKHDVLAVGSGLGQSDARWEDIMALKDDHIPSVWDADALNMLAKRHMPLGPLAIITPHMGEAARLLDEDISSVLADPFSAADRLHEKYACAVHLKSAVSILYDGQEMTVNLAGTPALAKGGSGDALCGILAGILAQQKVRSPMKAMQAAALWLGLAGQKAQQAQGPYSVLTSDVIDAMGPALLDI